MRTEIDRAIEDLCEWVEREPWSMRVLEVEAAHLTPVVDAPGLSPADTFNQLPAEIAEPVWVFMLEDFFTRRFGAGGEINVVDAFLRRRGRRESEMARSYLIALRDSVVSLYEVVDIDRGRSMTVRDLVRGGEPVVVDEKLGSAGAGLGDRLAARVVTAEGRNLVTGAVLRFRAETSRQLEWAFEEMASDLEAVIRESPEAPGKTAEELWVLARESLVVAPFFAPVLTQFWLVDAEAHMAAATV